METNIKKFNNPQFGEVRVMNIEIEVDEKTVDLVNKILITVLQCNNDLSEEQQEKVEFFRRRLILPFAVNSVYPIAVAFSKFFGKDLKYVNI